VKKLHKFKKKMFFLSWPKIFFSKFDVDKLVRIADIYCDDFSFDDRKTIKDQL
jgi:hypothetical protein